MAIAQNTALFSILGTTYGGNGQTTFGLPNFSSRVGVGVGQGPGLQNYDLGQMAGEENVTLIVPNLPAHIHPATGTVQTSASADNTNPTGNYVAPSTDSVYGENGGGGNMATNSVWGVLQPNSGDQPHPNMQPFLAMNYIICMYGIFPARD